MLLAVHYRVMEDLGSLESTQEARVALGYASSNSYASFVLSKLPACSITRQCTLKHEPIVNYSSPRNFLQFLLVQIEHVMQQCSSAERHHQPLVPFLGKYPDGQQSSVKIFSVNKWGFRKLTIGLITVFGAILTGRQSSQKLRCLYGNPTTNNFFQN